MSEGGSETRSGIGARLRAGREKMGLTQLQVAEKLHVDAKVVEALETERFEVLGAAVFVRGHLKRYCELIGESAAELLEIYSAATKAVLPDLRRLPKIAPDASPSRLAVPALVVLIGFVLLGVVWWVVKSIGNPEGVPKRGSQPVVIAPDVPEEPVASADAPSTTSAGANGASRPAAAARAVTPSATQAAGATRAATTVSGAAAGAATQATAPAPGAANVAGQATAGAAGAAAGASAATAPARGKAMEVTLRFTSDSWVEVYDAKGEKLFYDVGAADSSHTVSGTPPFRVTVANAPGVSLDVNGKPATVPANAVKGAEAQFTINRSGRIVRTLPAAGGG